MVLLSCHVLRRVPEERAVDEKMGMIRLFVCWGLALEN